jgi:ATP-dependent Clp protease ATP-binding subunit ClpX
MRCSFCGRPDTEVAKLVAGPARLFSGPVYICDRCAAQAVQIMEAHTNEDPPLERRSDVRQSPPASA